MSQNDRQSAQSGDGAGRLPPNFISTMIYQVFAIVACLFIAVFLMHGLEVVPAPKPTATPSDADPAVGRIWIVDAGSAAANDANPGTATQPLRSIASAARQALPGDEVVVRPGVYRECVSPGRGGEASRPIVYRAEFPGRTTISGADPWAPTWVALSDGIFRTEVPVVAPTAGANPFLRTISLGGSDESKPARPSSEPMPVVLGQIALNGVPLEQVETQAELAALTGSWMVSSDGVHIQFHPPFGFDPTRDNLEISVRSQVFAPIRRGLGYIVVRGFVFELAANQGPFPMRGMVSVRSGHDWTIEDCTVRYAATVGIDCGSETWDVENMDADPADRNLILGGRHMVRGNHVYRNGLSGIAGWNHSGTQITGNIVEGNNRQHFPRMSGGWEEWAGIKLHCTDSTISGNLVRDNHGYGIWIDGGHADAIVRNNLVLRNVGAGIFLELNGSKGHPCRVEDNIVAWTRSAGFYRGFGVYSHDASDILIQRNLIFANAGEAVLSRVITEREAEGKPVEASRISVQSNLLVGNGGAIALPWPDARSEECTSDGNRIDGGLFCILGMLEGPVPKTVQTAVTKLHERHPPGMQIVPGPQPRLDLAAWQRITGLDKRSTESEIDVDEVDVDIAERSWGARITAAKPGKAGPQALREGTWIWAPVR